MTIQIHQLYCPPNIVVSPWTKVSQTPFNQKLLFKGYFYLTVIVPGVHSQDDFYWAPSLDQIKPGHESS